MCVLHLVYSEGVGAAQLGELSLRAQQFGLNFLIHICQQVLHISHGRRGEFWDRQLQDPGEVDFTF